VRELICCRIALLRDVYRVSGKGRLLVVMLARIPLPGGGSILVEGSAEPEGPVKAGRMGEAIHDMSTGLHTVLEPVVDTARSVLEQLRKAGPGEVEVEFGVDLSVQAGAVITKGGAGCHLKVRMTWSSSEVEQG
jgi:Trypsin-co-occurring domain 1